MGLPFAEKQKIDLPDAEAPALVPITSSGLINGGKQALGKAHCLSGLPLDLTRNLEIWVCAQLETNKISCDKEFQGFEEGRTDCWLSIKPGYGVGIDQATKKVCLSSFSRDLLHRNLRDLVPVNSYLTLEVIFPKGRELAERTSNKAFGVVDGLSIIGTTSNVQISASSEQLQKNIEELNNYTSQEDFSGTFIYVIGENGLDLAAKLGLHTHPILKIGNWIGPLLVAAAEAGVKRLLLFGYHGKLIKLAGDIFHTHHHLADARIEVLTAVAVKEQLPVDLIQGITHAVSVEEAYLLLKENRPDMAEKLWTQISNLVEQRSQAYIRRYGKWNMEIGSALFDRQRSLRWAGPLGRQHLNSFGVKLEH